MTERHADQNQVLAVNVTRRWGEVERGITPEGDVVLGAWSPWAGRSTTVQLFDPDRIAVVMACRRGETMAVYDVDGWHWTDDHPRRRIVFHGQPSTTYAAHLNAPAPTWKVGEGIPVKLLPLNALAQGDPSRPGSEPAHHAVVGQAVIVLNEDHLTVSVPPHYTVTLTTRPQHRVE
ncbi:hypothetical protein ACIG3E_33110 [Streptomyces sp. NPDC053474]|uniref:hypothetical protein n=1 Tax=Streptomyces sp. NPDC053474 TaxID=3365704 RepID=UPI0037D55F32